MLFDELLYCFELLEREGEKSEQVVAVSLFSIL